MAFAVPPSAPSLTLYQATDSRLKDLEAAANRCATPADALLLYNNFRHVHKLSADTQKRFDEQYKIWKERAEQNLVKMGSKWVAAEDAKTAATEADKLIADAYEEMGTEDYKKARELLIKASRRDAGGIRADYILGLLNTPLFANHPPSAQQHFTEVLTRWPEHVPALNNLALIDVRMRRYDTALNRWELALSLAPQCTEIYANLRHFVDEAKGGRIAATPAQSKRAARLLEKEKDKADKEAGWQYLPVVLPNVESLRTGMVKSETRIACSHGIGFVIAPHQVLANLRSVKDAEFLVAKNEQNAEFPAKVIATSEELGVALLEIAELPAPPMKLVKAISAESRRSSFDIQLANLAQERYSFRPSSADFVDISDDQRYVYLTTNLTAGESGGVICNSDGNAVAYHLGHFKAQTGTVSAGVLIEPILRAFQKDLKWAVFAEGAPKLSPAERKKIAGASTICIRGYKAAMVRKSAVREASELLTFVDTSCSACAGTGKAACTARGCNNGSASVRVSYADVEGIGKAVVTRHKTVKVLCKVCEGAGVVPCTHCRGAGVSTKRKGPAKNSF